MTERLLNIVTRIDLTTEICCNCGIVFAMPTEIWERKKEKGTDFYCPNGHCMVFTESTATKLRRAEERLREQTAYSTNLSHQLDGALKQVSIKKGVITRLKNRVQNGVCPECHRHFTDLERHMKSKHSKS
jgi:hypothetical protein